MKKILLSCACCLLAVGLLAGCDNEEEVVTPDEPETTVPSTGDDGGSGAGEGKKEGEEGAGTTLQYVEVQELVSGESYYFGYPNGEDYYFFNGSLYSTSALYCTENVEEALMVTVTGDDTDGWTLTYTGTDSEEYTIYCYLYTNTSNSNTSADITAVKTSELEEALKDDSEASKTNATATFTWNSEHAGLSVMLGETACYVSTYATYKEISLSKGNFDYAASHFYSAVEIPNPTAVTVSAEETSVKVGGSLQLTATVEPEGAYADMTWSSSDNSVAIVSDTGLVKGISEANEVTITATSVANPSAAGSITIAVLEAEEGDKFEVDVTAQYIIDYFERDNSGDSEEAIATGNSGHYALGSGSNDTANEAEKYGFDVIGGATMNFGAFDVEWFNGSGTATKVWSDNTIRIYWATNSGNGNGGGFKTTPHEGWEITSFYVYDNAGKLAGSTLTTISSGSESTALTSGTDYTIDSSSKKLQTVDTSFTTSDTLQFQNTATSSNNMQLTSIKITCTKTSASV